jgi:hypothetical protein
MMAEFWVIVEIYLTLKLEIEMSMNKKGKFVARVNDCCMISQLKLLK